MTEQNPSNPNNRRKRLIAGSAVALVMLGGGMGVAAAQSNPSPSRNSNSASSQQDHGDKADPKLNSSITAPETADVEGASEADDAAAETAEQATLAKLAKVTPAEATAAALKAVPGTAATPKLGNENGSVVYDVEVTSTDGKTRTDLKVDAGNAKVLARGTEGNAHDAPEKGDQPDTSVKQAPRSTPGN